MKYSIKIVFLVCALFVVVSSAFLKQTEDPTVKTCDTERLVSCGIVMEDNDWLIFKNNFKKGCSYDPEKSKTCSTGFIAVPKDLKNDVKSIKTNGNCVCNFSFLFEDNETFAVQTNETKVDTKGKKVDNIYAVCSKTADNLRKIPSSTTTTTSPTTSTSTTTTSTTTK